VSGGKRCSERARVSYAGAEVHAGDRAREHGARCAIVERAAFGIERRVDGGGCASQARDHFPDDVIIADAQSVAEKPGRQMAIAEMPGNPLKSGEVRCGEVLLDVRSVSGFAPCGGGVSAKPFAKAG
jgi:hypothetical protein